MPVGPGVPIASQQASPSFRNLQNENAVYQNLNHATFNKGSDPILDGSPISGSPMNQTLDPSAGKLILGGEKHFIQYAPVFAAKGDPYSPQAQTLVPQRTSAGVPSSFHSTMDSRPPRKASRVGRWDPKTVNQDPYDDLNERDVGFVLDQAIDQRSMVQQQFSGQGQPPAGRASVMAYPPSSASRVSPTRQSLSLRPQMPRTMPLTSAKAIGSGLGQIGGGVAAGQPSQTLHSAGLNAMLPRNPLIGFSEGARQRNLYKQEFINHAFSQAEGSINDVKERSRSKSRRARYEAARRHAANQQEEASMVDLMNRTRALYSPNRLALKQRYAFSRAGSLARSSSPILKVGESNDLNSSLVGPQQQLKASVDLQNQTLNPANVTMPKVIDIGMEFYTTPDYNEQLQRAAEYKATLLAQMQEKDERKRRAKAKEAEDEARTMNEYANYYRFGALNAGGGSPIRDRNGEIISQHVPFSSQSQHNGGVEESGLNFVQVRRANNSPQGHLHNQMLGAQGTATGNGVVPFDQTANSANRMMNTANQSYSPKKQEIQHMKPSNMFEDITEAEFNKREQDKKAYQNELYQQMMEAKERKRMDKERRNRQEVEDDAKIHAALNQMKAAYRREENLGNGDLTNSFNDRSGIGGGRDSALSGKTGGILKNQQDRSMTRGDSQMGRGLALTPVQPYGPQGGDPYSSAVPQSQPDYFASQTVPMTPMQATPMMNYSSAHVEQLDRLNRVQAEIDAKNSADRLETEKIFKDLMDSNRKLNEAMLRDYGSQGVYDLRNFAGVGFQAQTAPPYYGRQALESSFTSGNAQQASFMQAQGTRAPFPMVRPSLSPIGSAQGAAQSDLMSHQPSATPQREADRSITNGNDSSVTGQTEKPGNDKSVIGKLDTLMDEFQQPEAPAGQTDNAADLFDER